MKEIKVDLRPVQVEEYQKLRKTTGWKMFSDEVVRKSLQNDQFTVVASLADETIGIGRIIGDGAIYFYIQDLIVLPAYQGRGVGRALMEAIEDYLEHNTPKNAFIGLMSAEGKESFYRQFGYQPRDANAPGMFKRK